MVSSYVQRAGRLFDVSMLKLAVSDFMAVFQQIKSAVNNKNSSVSKLKLVFSDSAVKGGSAFPFETLV